MSTIVKIRNKKSGAVYAYEQTARWDPEKGQSRPVRRYLGRYDEETDTIIPTSGRRGRRPSRQDAPAAEPAQAAPEPAEPAQTPPSAELEALRAENARLRAALAEAEASARALLAAVEGLAG